MGSPMIGVVMVRLSDEDGRAVDILLDRTKPPAASKRDGSGDGDGNGHADGDGGPAAFAVGSDQLAARLDVASSLLQTLGQMPATEPPENLIERTLAYIEARGGLGRTPAPPGSADRPSAGPAV
jgi:hypothetical protein